MNLKARLPGILLFLLAFQLALWGLNPSFYMDDSPEIITAAASLGIAHPPGYPLYTLLGRILSLLPLGPLCLRVNLLSALVGALSCLVLFQLLLDRFKLEGKLAFAFALLWMAGATAFPAALSAKNGIYQMTAAFFVAVLAASLRGRLPLAFFLFGLSLTNHWMSMLAFAAGPAYLAWTYWIGKEKAAKDLIQCLAFLVMGLSLYLYLPLRSSLEPLINWAHPVDLGNFLRHVSRYVDKNKDLTGDPVLWVRQGFFYWRSAFFEFSGIGLLGLIGVAAAWKERRRAALGMLLGWAGLFAAVCLYSKFSSQRVYLMQNYSIASFIFIPIFSALGSQFLLSRLNLRWSPIASRATVLLVLVLAFFRLSQGSQAYYTYSYDYVLNAWRSVPRGGFFFCKGDVLDFPAWYFQLLEGKRPDLPVLGGGSLPMDWYRIRLSKDFPDLKVPYPRHEKGKEYISGHLFKWMLDENPGHRAFFTFPDLRPDGLEELSLAPNGLTQEGSVSPVAPSLDEAEAGKLWGSMRLRHFNPPDDSVDEVTWDYFLKDYAMARSWLGLALANGALQKKGTRDREQLQKSLGHWVWAANWDKSDPLYPLNAGKVCYYLGNDNEGMDWMRKTSLLDPMNTEAYYFGGLMAGRAGNTALARRLFEKTLQLEPHHALAAEALARLTK
jgi:hypothetical protein